MGQELTVEQVAESTRHILTQDGCGTAVITRHVQEIGTMSSAEEAVRALIALLTETFAYEMSELTGALTREGLLPTG